MRKKNASAIISASLEVSLEGEIMKEYDILFIVKPNLGEEKYTQITDKFKEWITKNNGEIMGFNAWGHRPLYHTSNNTDQGYFIECQFKGDNKTLDSIKRNIAVNENFIRHLIVTLDSIQAKEIIEKEPVEKQ